MRLTSEQVSNLTLLADFMEGLVAENFSMNSFRYDCKTPACAFGWACMMPQFQMQGLSLEYPLHSWRLAARIFGTPSDTDAEITHGAYAQLFHGDLSKTIKTPQQWAAHCRAFLKENGYEVKSDPFKTFMDRALAPVEESSKDSFDHIS